MNDTRRYTMRARAAGVAETRRRILDATFALSGDRLIPEISLVAVAERAGVSVQTVLRQFGNRANLFEATAEHAGRLVAAEREAPPGDIRTALGVLVDHYERRGDTAVMMLAQESTDAVVATVVDHGRRLHRQWVCDVFGPLLEHSDEHPDGAATDVAIDLLVVATDVYTWKLLRRDRRLGRDEVQHRMTRLVEAALHASGLDGAGQEGRI